ncbi:MAG: hypothetical protein E6Q98_16040 [Rhodospirillaceae bacterium]|nr:MAG: hypothetical protein E6Q98_16040 [Rhodospirillaceae bacterium]
MALLDVTDVLTDPDFTSTIRIARSTESIGETGRAVIAQQVIDNILAVVTPGQGTKSETLADLMRVQGVVTVHTQFRLSDGRPDGKPDVVTWSGADYIVLSVNDFSQFGAGFVMAICQLRSLYADQG